MKKSVNPGLLSALIISTCLIGMGSLTQSCNITMDKKEAKQWYSNSEWSHDLKLKPHESTNQEEFEKQYKTNQVWWDKAFDWLKTNDLASIEPGTYIIDEGNVRAIVSEAPAPALEDVRWEAHHDFNDIQLIVSGQALMGVAPVSTARVTEDYDPANDIGFFEAEGFESVKKIVIKVRAISEEK